MSLLTETADYDEGGSWGRMSEGWPEIVGDKAYDMYVFANKVDCIPYGSYVLMRQKYRYGAKNSCLRVGKSHIAKLKNDFKAAGKPSPEESIKRCGKKSKAAKWW